MNREEILAMKPSKELDALVAEKVMGHPMPDFIPENALDLYLAGTPIHYDSWTCVCRYDEGDVPKWIPDPYSSDISAAWQVVEKMITLGFEITFNYCHTDKWSISFFDESPKMFEGIGKEAPEAICKAALLSKLEES